LIYLIRHTEPNIEKGICYGQADLDVVATFVEEATVIKNVLPTSIEIVYSSPLQRCSKLASFLFPQHSIQYNPQLMELNCGHWELQPWDDIPRAEIEPWFNDYVHVAIPGGESYTMLYNRIVAVFESIANEHSQQDIAIVAHGGVLRSILSYITHTELINSFDAFKLHYGAVVALEKTDSGYTYKMLSNIEGKKERHQPSYL
jgi:alpha-ribazole phosphatase